MNLWLFLIESWWAVSVEECRVLPADELPDEPQRRFQDAGGLRDESRCDCRGGVSGVFEVSEVPGVPGDAGDAGDTSNSVVAKFLGVTGVSSVSSVVASDAGIEAAEFGDVQEFV